MITGDEKWIVYVKCKRSWGPKDSCLQTAAKAGFHPKVMLYIWWDIKGVVYYEPREPNHRCHQILRTIRLREAVQNWSGGA